MAACCRIELLGDLRIVDGERTITRFLTQKTAALLACLAYHRDHAHQRESLIEMLWPWAAPAAGRQSLSQSLSWLRHQLEPPGTAPGSVLLADRNSIQLNPAATTSDVVAFESALALAAKADVGARTQRLEEAIALYHGELLPGLHEPWIAPEAERLAECFVDAVETLTGLLVERGDTAAAVSPLERAIAVAPLREEPYRRLMRLYATLGEPQAALETYGELQAALHDERGAHPSATTLDLARDMERLASAGPRDMATISRVALRPVRRGAVAPLPTGTVTLLAIRPMAGVAEPDVSALHEEFRSHGGTEVAAATDAASRIAAFARAGDALNCAAVVMLRATTAQAHPAIAVHTTDLALGPDAAYPLAPLDHARRLVTAANQAQVLYSETAAGIISHGLNGGLGLRELGTYRLPGADSSERLYQLDYPGGPVDALAPRGAESGHLSHLPLRLTRFFGRANEMEKLATLLAGGTQLVTIAGGPGYGKTRLAIEIASRMIDCFHGRVWFVPLADLRAGSDILDRALDPLGIQRSPQAAPLDQIAAALASEPALIIFDSFEHLLAASGEIATLIERLPHVTCLVTSRRRLGLPSEHVLAIDPLPIPSLAPLTNLRTNESVNLLLDRARDAQPDFELTEFNAGQVTDLCRRLDGVPLAIEMAAARLNVLTPAQVLERLGHAALLSNRRREDDDRHRSLRAAVEWSCSLLPPGLQSFFARLSVFRGGWTADAAEAVCEEPLASDYLSELVECSLVALEPALIAPRFRMLEMVREAAARRLAASGQEAPCRARHFEFFHKLAEKLTGLNEKEFLDLAQADLDNFLAAMDPAAVGDEGVEDQLCIACSLSGYWGMRDLRLGRKVYASVLRRSQAAVPTYLRAKTLDNAGTLAWKHGDLTSAAPLLEEALEINRAIGRRDLMAGGLSNLAGIASDKGDRAAARSLLEEALAINRETGNRHWEAVNLNNLGGIALDRGDLAAARPYLEAALAIRRELGEQRGAAMTLGNLAQVTAGEGDRDTARRMLEESLAVYRELRYQLGIPSLLVDLATLLIGTGDKAAARTRLAEALPLIAESDLKSLADDALGNAAWLACDTSDGTIAPGVPVATLQRAARIEGAAQSLRQTLSITMTPTQIPGHETFVAALRAGLGAADFAAAWAEGMAMTFEEAMAYARAGIESP